MTTTTDKTAADTWPQFARDTLRCGAVPTTDTYEIDERLHPAVLTAAVTPVSVLMLTYAWSERAWWAVVVLVLGLGTIALGLAAEAMRVEPRTYQVPAGSAAARIIDPHTGRWPRAAVDAVLEGRGLQKVERTVENVRPGAVARWWHMAEPERIKARQREVEHRRGTIATGVTPRRDGDVDLHLRLGPGVSHAQLDAIGEQLARALHVRRVDGLATTGISSGETTIRLTMREAPAVPDQLDDEWE